MAGEHNDQVIGESLYLIKYVDGNFDGPALLPDLLDLIIWKLTFISLRMDHSSLFSSVTRACFQLGIRLINVNLCTGQSSHDGLRPNFTHNPYSESIKKEITYKIK
ncbi:glutathione S-transferase L2, chloroplastic-like [Primulina tabacum]|uniref:glutathione S-transferase L2, chloroplastic-like n=1 Tax=Primulina tabacum TaxID=48773 RepID=UPI003F5A6555